MELVNLAIVATTNTDDAVLSRVEPRGWHFRYEHGLRKNASRVANRLLDIGCRHIILVDLESGLAEVDVSFT